MTTTLPLNKWASPAQLRQIAKDYRAAVALIDAQGWTKAISDGKKDKGPICASRALGIVTGFESWDAFAGRAPLALAACSRITKMLLTQHNDRARDWADMRSVMVGIADDCDQAAKIGDINA